MRIGPPGQALLDLAGIQKWRNDCCSCSHPLSVQVQSLVQNHHHRELQTPSSYLKEKRYRGYMRHISNGHVEIRRHIQVLQKKKYIYIGSIKYTKQYVVH